MPEKRKKPRKTRPGKNGLFVKKIFDAETGRKISQRNFKTGETVFLFASGTNQLPRDKSTYISFETVIAEVRKAIQREMELAEQIKKKLAKGKAIAQIADEIEETEDKVLGLIGQIKSE